MGWGCTAAATYLPTPDPQPYFAATNMISTSPSAFTRPVRTVARAGKSFVKIVR